MTEVKERHYEFFNTDCEFAEIIQRPDSDIVTVIIESKSSESTIVSRFSDIDQALDFLYFYDSSFRSNPFQSLLRAYDLLVKDMRGGNTVTATA